MLRPLLEGTPASFPVQPFNPSAPVYWEAGNVAMLDTYGNAVVASGNSATVIGILADRRNTSVGMSNETFLPSNVGQYGDESLFNQPGYGNSLYGTGSTTLGGGGTATTNNIIPANTIPTTTLLRDETAANPNVSAVGSLETNRYVTVYIRGGIYQTDQYDSTVTSSTTPGQSLYYNTTTGQLSTTSANSTLVGLVTKPLDGNSLLEFKLTLV